ncbi:MAG: Fpg/Nei family DNA glycosylase [Opitutaceae bacterium]|nr:Fpg/Nei family DNA glycosylase [Verrucomicrobiales bacterium]
MPELAEVEYYRRQWTPGLNQRVIRVHLNRGKRVLRGNDIEQLERSLTGARLVDSLAHGKQMLFEFSSSAWLGVHLGMTGSLRAECGDFHPGKHDHLVLFQKERALVFSDPRLFGRLLFEAGSEQPAWWTKRAPDLVSSEFTTDALRQFLRRRSGSPIKAVLLMQERFPGIGNWMADEILWRSGLHPSSRAGDLNSRQIKMLHGQIRWVCRGALRVVAKDFTDPPKSWLFPHRWKSGGLCPRDGMGLKRKEIGGRTTCWCPTCQGG